MKNEFRNDGRQSMAWLADQGASEAEYDSQGGVVHKEKQPPESEYERLKRCLYELGLDREKGVVVGGPSMRLFDEYLGFPDLAHAIREGVRDRDKLEFEKKTLTYCKWDLASGTSEEVEIERRGDGSHFVYLEPYHEVCPTHPEGDDDEPDLSDEIYKIAPDPEHNPPAKLPQPEIEGVRIEDNGDIIFVGALGREILQDLDPNDFHDEPTLIENGKVYKGWESVKKLKRQSDKPADDWIDHDGSEIPGWIGFRTAVNCILKSGKVIESALPAKFAEWTASPNHNPVVKYRIAERSTLPDGWRRNMDGERPSFAGMVKYVNRSGYHGQNAISQLHWGITGGPGDIMWYRLSKGS